MLVKIVHLPICVLLIYFLVGCKTSPNAKLDFSDGSYEGQLNGDGEKHGVGIYRWIDGSIYEGDYLNDLRHGQGRFLWANGESYQGEYLKDERTGKGTYNWPDGSSYKGEFLSGKRHGWGHYQSAEGVIYEGEWFDDLQHGQGTLIYADGRKVQGIWRKGILISKPAVLPTSSEKPKIPQFAIEEQVEDSPKEQLDPDPIFNREDTEDFKMSEPSNSPVFPSITVENDSFSQESTGEDTPSNLTPPEITSEEKESLKEENVDLNTADPTTGKGDEETIPDWAGSVAEAEAFFITELIDGFDTIRVRATGVPFTGRMRIVDSTGTAKGEVNLLEGRMHGEEIFYNQEGEIIERNFWANGSPIGQ